MFVYVHVCINFDSQIFSHLMYIIWHFKNHEHGVAYRMYGLENSTLRK